MRLIEAILSLWQILLPLAFVVGLVWFTQSRARRNGLDADFLSPRGDPTRHILASLVLRGPAFRNMVIRRLRNPFLAHAAEPGLEMPLIQAAAQKIENQSKPHQWGLVLGLLLLLLLPTPGQLKLLLLLAWVAYGVFLQYRDRFQLMKPFEAANYDIAKLRGQYGVQPSVPATVGAVPVLVSGVFNPFIGLGLNLGGWNIALDVTRAAEGKTRSKDLTALQIEKSITDAILALQIPNLSIVDRLLVSGVETTRVESVQSDRFVAPAREVAPDVADSFHGTPDERARVYRFATINTFVGEVVVSYAFRVLRRGASLGVEVVHLAAPPLAPKYREIDFLRVMGLWTGFVWFISALARIPAQLFGALVSIFMQIGEIIDDILGGHVARERREIARNPAYNYGARWSLRSFTASPNYNSWFQKADVQQYLRGLEEQVLNALRDCLEAHDIDVRAFSSQSLTVHNNNVQITSARDVNLQGVAIGQGAKATSVLQRLGIGSRDKKAA